jgi:hypothetical protein
MDAQPVCVDHETGLSREALRRQLFATYYSSLILFLLPIPTINHFLFTIALTPHVPCLRFHRESADSDERRAIE